MKDKKNSLLLVSMVLLLLIISFVFQYMNTPKLPKEAETQKEETHEHAKILGMPAMDFSMPSVSGKVVSLSDFKDKNNVILVFLTTQQPYFQDILKSLRKMESEYAKHDFKSVIVCMKDPIAKVRDYAKKNNLNENLLADINSAVSMKYLSVGMANTFIIDKQSRVYGQSVWMKPEQFEPNTEAVIKRMLSGKPPEDIHSGMGVQDAPEGEHSEGDGHNH